MSIEFPVLSRGEFAIFENIYKVSEQKYSTNDKLTRTIVRFTK